MQNQLTQNDQLMGLVEAAKLFKVNNQTIFNWEKNGWLTRIDGKFSVDELRKAKVLRACDAQSRGVTRQVFAKCSNFGIKLRRGRISLADIEVLLQAQGTIEPEPGHSEENTAAVRYSRALDLPTEVANNRNRLALFDWYHSNSKSPCALPDWFFDSPVEPEFIPPSGILFTQIVEERTDDCGNPVTTLRQSRHWVGREYYSEQEFDYLGTALEAMESWLSLNEAYRQSEIEWHSEYERRNRTRMSPSAR